MLVVDVSVHVCATCSRMFRAQPPFLRPRAIYTQRVVQKAIDAMYRDGLAARCVPDRLARDFWVRPDEKMVRLWCRTYAAEIDFAVDYQPWVVANFSGILCVDEVYQGDLALLLAVDPAAPDGDRLVGYPCCQRPGRSIKAWSEPSSIAYGRPASILTKSSLMTRACTPRYWLTSGPWLCTSCACSTPHGG